MVSWASRATIKTMKVLVYCVIFKYGDHLLRTCVSIHRDLGGRMFTASAK